ncbi:hypothetical protein FUAX_13430 [Fulvitalea axinellae]|uniref:Uncharacterized protein n=1 Tax=Fulvitalea axinellae TaxID=1182444 RepID=A0AAU9CJ12_9BACT|nr:hypothetical protein FUAX_13430 [Fulvitalea axinellae]
MKVYELLEALKKRPAMFLGNEYTFDTFNAFMSGYLLFRERDDLKSEEYNDFFDFNYWLLGHIPEHFGQAGGWHWQIKNRNKGNDQNAFREFFEFLDLFKVAKRKREIIEIEPFHFVVSTYNADHEKESEKHVTVSEIHKVTMEYTKTIWMEGYSEGEKVLEIGCLNETEFIKELDIRNIRFKIYEGK